MAARTANRAHNNQSGRASGMVMPPDRRGRARTMVTRTMTPRTMAVRTKVAWRAATHTTINRGGKRGWRCCSVLPMTTSRAGGRPPSATTTPRVGGIGGRRRWRRRPGGGATAFSGRRDEDEGVGDGGNTWVVLVLVPAVERHGVCVCNNIKC